MSLPANETDNRPRNPDLDSGLYQKYAIQRMDADPTGKHAECFYFVMDLNHDPYAYAALDLYANMCANTHPVLSYELKQKLRDYSINSAVQAAREEAIHLLTQQGYMVVKDGQVQL